MGEVLVCRDTEGRTVAEVDLDDTTSAVTEIVDRAREEGADLVWAHGGNPTMDGFVLMPGYAHLHAEHPVAGERLPPLEADAYGPLLAKAYLGQWGHKWVDPAQPLTGADREGQIHSDLRDKMTCDRSRRRPVGWGHGEQQSARR